MSKKIKNKTPFYALENLLDTIDKTRTSRNKVEKLILSEDKLQEINKTIGEAIKLSLDIEIEYFNNGIIETLQGKIEKVDVFQKCIVLNTKSLQFQNILDVNFI